MLQVKGLTANASLKWLLLILFLILLLCGVIFVFSTLPLNRLVLPTQNGVLDLSGVDLTNETVPLVGEWEFVYGRLLLPNELNEAERALIKVPSTWEDEGYPAHGCATYRLNIKTSDESSLTIFFPEIIGAASAWVNDELIYSAGVVSDTPQNAQIGIRNGLVTLFPTEGELELVIQVSNYDITGSGLFYPMYIGREPEMLKNFWRKRLLLTAVIGGMLFIGLYHFVLYLFRRRDVIYPLFSAICILTVLRMLFETNSLMQFFLPNGLGPILSRGYFVLCSLHCISIILFMLMAFRLKLNFWLRGFFSFCMLTPLAVAIFMPPWRSTNWMLLSLLPLLIITVLAIRRRAIYWHPYRMLYLISTMAFLIYGPVTKLIFENTLFVPMSVSALFMVLCQYVMLGYEYASARHEAERLNANLEELVNQRTAQLAASQLALREMISDISHDLKTPLTVLSNYLEILNDGNAVDGIEKAEYLGIAYHKNLDLQRLIGNLIEAARVGSGSASYICEWVDISDLADKISQKYGALARDKGLDFDIAVEGDFSIRIDQQRIWNVLDNLFYNALRHTDTGKISLTTTLENKTAVICMSDSGCGIAEQHLPHIFTRFYKISRARSAKDGSSGIGLYIAKVDTEGMGGTIAVESTEGAGTVFTLHFEGKAFLK